jgi:hypothetical protein
MDPNYLEQGEKINVQENEELSKEFFFQENKRSGVLYGEKHCT